MPKSRARRPVQTARPRRRGGSARGQASQAPAPAPARLPQTDGSGSPGTEWDCWRPLFHALDQPRFDAWVDRLAAVHDIDALLARTASAPAERSGPPQDEAQERARLLEETTLRWRLLEVDGDGALRPGSEAQTWRADDPRARTCFRAMVVVAAAECVVRSLPGRSYVGEQVSHRLAEVVAAAAGPTPWRSTHLEVRGGALEEPFVMAGVRRGVERLRWLGLLDSGPVPVAPPEGRALVEVLARGLQELPVPEPHRPDSRVTGPTFEVEAIAVVEGERRVRLVRISGSSPVSVLVDLLMTVFGLRGEGRPGLLSGALVWPRLAEAGLLTAAGADRGDPWTFAVGHAYAVEELETTNAVVEADSASVVSLVEHLGHRWELPLTTWGGVAEDVLLQLRVVRTVSVHDSRGLVVPSCLGGRGDHLAVADDDDESDAGEESDVSDESDDGYHEPERGAPFDLEAVEELVARVHRGRR